MTLRPLEGYAVAVTADRRANEQAELLRRRGAAVLLGPTITTAYLADDEALRSATVRLIDEPPDYLVATTGIGVRAWLETVATWGLAEAVVEALAGTRIVARGPKAVAAVQAGGLEVWERSPNEELDAILPVLRAESLAGRRVAVQEYGSACPEFAAALEAEGASVVAVPVYRWRLPDDPAPARRLVEAVLEGRLDAVTFTSAPAVRNLFAIAETIEASEGLRDAFNGGVVAACVGPVCASGASIEGVTNPLVPALGRLGLLVRALGEHLEGRRRTLLMGGTRLTVQGAAIEVGGEVVVLSAKERQVFDLLARTPGRVVSRAELVERVWGTSAPDSHVLEATIARLRRRLGPLGAAVGATLGRGYQLDPDEIRSA